MADIALYEAPDVPLALTTERWESTEPEQAASILDDRFGGMTFTVDKPDGMRIELVQVAEPRFAVHRLAISGGVQGKGTFPDVVAVASRRSGSYALDYRGKPVDTREHYLRPAGECRCGFLEARTELLVLSPHWFQSQLERYAPGARPRTPTPSRATPSNSQAARLWSRLNDELLTSIAVGSINELIIREELLDNIVRGLVICFPLVDHPNEHIRASRLDQAIDYVDAHLQEPIRLADIAEALDTSPRSLQLAFRHELQTTAVAWIRGRRLDAARADLRAAAVDEVSVAEVARRYGLGHLGRFSGQYRDRFGENPRDTLQRR